MNKDRIAGTCIVLELADCFEKWLAFNVAHGSSHFDNSDLRVSGRIISVKTAFDLIGNMGDDLDRTAAVVAAAFF